MRKTDAISFSWVYSDLVSNKFHASRPGNRVFFAASRREARAWLPYLMGIKASSLDFRSSAYFAILYSFFPRGEPVIDRMALSPAGTLVVHVQLHSHCSVERTPDGRLLGAGSCPPITPWVTGMGGNPWGPYMLMRIAKDMLPMQPRRLRVVTSPCPGPYPLPNGDTEVPLC